MVKSICVRGRLLFLFPIVLVLLFIGKNLLLYELSERKPGWRFTARCHTKTIGKRKSRRPRTPVLLTMKNMFSNAIASGSVLGNDKLYLSYILRLWIEIVKAWYAQEILEFYLVEVFLEVEISMKNLKIFKKIIKFSTFLKSLDPIELWNFKVSSIFHYHLYKLQHLLHSNFNY